MKKNIARLQFITSPADQISYQQQVESYVMGGGNWVQLRMKEESVEEIEAQARRIFAYCMEHGAAFILNDHVEIAARLGADGVHLGKNDMRPAEARELLGPTAIIGGTANTFEDVQRLVSQGVDYIGLGPYRFTSTKKNLSPVLGLEGYQAILKACDEAGITIPIVAIGGLGPDDFKGLFDAGCHGVALSSYITKKEQPGAVTLALLEQIGRLSASGWKRLFKH